MSDKSFLKDNAGWMLATVAIVVAAVGGFDPIRNALNGDTATAAAPVQAPATATAPAALATAQPVPQAAPVATPQPVPAPVEAEVARAATPTPAIPDAATLQAAPPAAPQPVAAPASTASALQATVEAATAASAPQAAVPQPATPQAAVQTAVAANTALFANAAPAPDFAETCAQDVENFASQIHVYFPSGGLSPDGLGIAQARVLAKMASDCPGLTIQVEGHSDPSGNPRTNLRLSEERAETVITRLAAQGWDTRNFVAVGLGDRVPSVVNGPEGRAYYDRRVEFSVVRTGVAPVATAASFSGNSTNALAAQRCVIDLQNAAASQVIVFGPRSVTANTTDVQAALRLANAAQACPGARLRIMGNYSDDPGAGETPTTGRLRAVVLMNLLVNAGIDPSQIIVGGRSEPDIAAVGLGLEERRVDFDVILEDG